MEDRNTCVTEVEAPGHVPSVLDLWARPPTHTKYARPLHPQPSPSCLVIYVPPSGSKARSRYGSDMVEGLGEKGWGYLREMKREKE